MNIYYKKILFFTITILTISNYKTYGIQKEQLVPNKFQSNFLEKERQDALEKNTNELIQEIATKIIDMSYQIQELSSDIQEINNKLTQIHNAVIPQRQKSHKSNKK
jgi:hypothetical protein